VSGILDTIQTPKDMQALPLSKLAQLAREIRHRIITVVGDNGGHLASNLGVVELTIALHYCFDFSQDRLLWDVGHQCYPHKLLTGRADRFESLRQAGGISGFPNFHESPYDLFVVGHAGTAISTAVGMAAGDQMAGKDTRVVAIVGDASVVNGTAFEGLNQAGLLKRQLLVVLNDNSMGISPTQGAMARHLAKFRTSGLYEYWKKRVKGGLQRLPVVGKGMHDMLNHLKEGIKATVSPHQIFEQLGLLYVGPTDGHDIEHLITLLGLLRDVQQPVLLHVHTKKGAGCDWASHDPTTFHGPSGYVLDNGNAKLNASKGKTWTKAFGEAIVDLAEKDDRIVALTAAMTDGTGLSDYARRFPKRFFDCGIAEGCTVDMAAGMAKAGMRPVVAIYSTFLQRAFDHVYQEVILQQLPVVFCLDRAGLVGNDGPTHHGTYDISYLRLFPKMVIMAPADEFELRDCLALAVDLPGPSAIRYPREIMPQPVAHPLPMKLGQSRRLRSGTQGTILAYGATVSAALDAAEILALQEIDVGVVNARFARPLDQQMLRETIGRDQVVLTVEDNSLAGGFGSAVLEQAREMGLNLDNVRCSGIPSDRLIEHGPRPGQLAEIGLDATGIAATFEEIVLATPTRRTRVRQTRTSQKKRGQVLG
jgi:1-deoxy-D-xylulose-5-phosphate synthase